MLPLSLAEVAEACGGTLERGDPAAIVTGASVDSRATRPGDLYIGLRGERHDGDAFAPAALAAGALAVAVREDTSLRLPAGTSRVIVDDGLAALQRLAADVRRRADVRVVAITGSAGKTSTKDILSSLLKPLASVVATRGNYNNEIGLPLTMLAIDAGTEVVVAELAMRGVGQIRDLARIARPDIGVITNIAPAHLEFVGTLEDVAAAKAELVEELGSGTAVVPAFEPLLVPFLQQHGGRVVTFGEPEGDVHAVEAELRHETTHALVDAFGHRAAIDFAFSGGHYLNDALAALAAFVELGFRLDEAKTGAAAIAFSGMRGEVVELADGGLLLNDAYNANPLATKAAIDHLVSLAGGRPTVAVLGDMYELGAETPVFHHEVGEYAAAKGVRVVAVGKLARDYLTGAPDEVWFADVRECVAALPEAVPPGSAVLVKASRALRLERVAEALSAATAAAEFARPDDGGDAPAAGSPADASGDGLV